VNFSSAQVIVTVTDVNDNSPTFDQNYTFTINEVGPNHIVGTVTAMDNDVGSNAAIMYSLSPNGAALFDIDPSTGEITTSTDINFETDPNIIFTVFGTDGGSPSFTGSTMVTVEVSDINDNPPVFAVNAYSVTVDEHSPNRSVVFTVEATDDDDGSNGAIVYSITHAIPSGSYFYIEPTSGAVRVNVNSLPSISQISEYTLIIQAQDMATIPLSSSVIATIRVTDVNEPPMFEQSRYILMITENTTIFSYTVTAIDPDTYLNYTSIEYSIPSTSTGSVSGSGSGSGSDPLPESNLDINETTGVLSVVTPIDFENVRNFSFLIAASDPNDMSLSDTAIVEVRVQDINDNPPMFNNSIYMVMVSENATVSSVITDEISAYDVDTVSNGMLQYAIDRGVPDSDKFAINEMNGVITLVNPLNATAAGSYELTISVNDGTFTSQATVNVIIMDINDHIPIFIPPFSTTVMELTPVSHEIIMVSAIDSDLGDFGNVQYSIVSGAQDTFEINNATGSITLTKTLDYEEITRYILTVRATDGAGVYNDVNITVNVMDQNDNVPEFDMDMYDFDVDEGVQPLHNIGTVSANDADSGTFGDIEYSIVNATNFPFVIDQRSGEISLAAGISLDYENVSLYSLEVVATDMSPTRNATSVYVNISVVDENDNIPTFNQSLYRIEVSENVTINSTIFTALATDADSGENSRLTYRIMIADTDMDICTQLYHINPSTGVVINIRELDADNSNNGSQCQLIIEARDAGVPVLSAIAFYIVTVANVNEQPPEFIGPTVATFDEDVHSGTVVLIVTAQDLDNVDNPNDVEYALNGTSNFVINPSSGAISVAENATIDRDVPDGRRESFTVIATDKGIPPLSTSREITFVFDDVNDSPPIFILEQYSVEIRERTPINTPLVTVAATDADNPPFDNVRYFIETNTEGQTNYGKFYMEPRSGRLELTNQIDYDTEQRVYLLNISADDSVHFTFITVRVEVLDTNDIRPQFNNLPNNTQLPENAIHGQFVFRVSATDEDAGVNGRIMYSLLGDGGGRFTIDESSGRVYVNGDDQFDFDSNNKTYVLEVMATDSAGSVFNGSGSGSGAPPNVDLNDTMLNTTSMLTITLTDINDNPPIFTEDPYEVSVLENADSSTVVVIVVANDADEGVNEMVRYSISDGDDGKFVIDEMTGSITPVPSLDFEQQAIYNLSIVAVDMGDVMLSGTSTVIINILDFNDNAPQFVNEPYSATVVEHSLPETFVIQVMAEDQDTNNNLTYYFPDENVHFSIDNITGEIFTTNSSIDRETNGIIDITVRVNDTDGLFDITVVVITVEDINDNSPRFIPDSYSESINETFASGAEVARISADDDDEGVNSQITFDLSPSNQQAKQYDRFEIDMITGIVTIKNLGNRPLCFNSSSSQTYLYTVIATDRGNMSLNSTTTLRITVNVGNAYVPQFVKSTFIGRLQEEAPIGAIAVGSLQATDNDRCNEGFEFGIEGNGSEFFNINSVTGQITLARNLTDNSASFDFTLRVTDVGHPETEILSSTVRVVILVGQLLPIKTLVSSPGLVVPPLKRSSSLDYQQEIWFYNGGSSNDQPNVSFSLGALSEQLTINVIKAPGTRVKPVLVTQTVSYDRPEVIVFAQVMSESYDTVSVGPTSVEVELNNIMTGDKVIANCTTQYPHSTCSVVATVPDNWFSNTITINVSCGLGSNAKSRLGTVEAIARPADCLSSSFINEQVLVVLPSSVQFTNTSFDINVYVYSNTPIRTFLLHCTVGEGFVAESVCSKGELTMQVFSFEQELNVLGHSSGILPTQTGLRHLFQATIRINADTVIPVSGILPFTCVVDYMSDIYRNRIITNRPAIHAGGSASTCTLTEGFIRVAANTLLQMFPYAANTSILNTAALDLIRISSSVTVVGIYSSGQVNHQLKGLYCNSSSSAIKVKSNCSEIYLTGSETTGGNPANVKVYLGDIQADLSLLVWYPISVELYFSDTVLNAISGYSEPPCGLITYQETIFRVQATFEAGNLRQDAIITSLIGDNHITYTGNILNIIAINELERRAVAQRTGTTTVRVDLPSGLSSQEVTIVVTNDMVTVDELSFSLRTGLMGTVSNAIAGVNYIESAQVSTHYDANYRGAKVHVLVEAVFDDGHRQTITPALGLILTSLNTSIFEVDGTTINILGSGSGRVVHGEWFSSCRGSTVLNGIEYININLMTPTNIFLTPDSKILLGVDNAASRIGISLTADIKAYLNHSDGIATDVTTDSSLNYSISNGSILSVNNGVISTLGNTGSSTIQVIYNTDLSDENTTLVLSSNTIEVEVVGIEEIQIKAVPYPPYPSSEDVDASSRRPFRRSFNVPSNLQYQQAMIVVTAVLSNDDEVDITEHKNVVFTESSNILEIDGNIVRPTFSGIADVTASITGTSLRASLTFNISRDILPISSFSTVETIITNSTLRGIANSPIICMYTAIDIEFEDESILSLLDSMGRPIYPGLLSFRSSDTSSITVDEQNGEMTLINNSPGQVNITISAPDIDPYVLPLWANLDPAVGDVDIGDEVGFPLSIVSQNISVPIYLNSEGRAIGAMEIEVGFNNASVVFSGGDVMIGSDWPNGTFFSTSTDFNDKVVFGGISTSAITGSRRMHIATLQFTVTGNESDIYFDPRVITLTELGLNAVRIGELTPRRSQAGRVAFSDSARSINDANNFTVPTYCSMPHSNDINGDSLFDLRDVMYTQNYATLQSSMSPTDAQLEAMDANKDGLVTASDVEFLSRAHFGLLRFVSSLELTPIDEAGSNCVMTLNITLIDRYNCPATTNNTDVYFMLISTNPNFQTQFGNTTLVSGQVIAMPIQTNTYGVWLQPDYLGNGVFGIQTEPNNIVQINLGFTIVFATISMAHTQQPRDIAMIGDNVRPYTYSGIDLNVDSISIALPNDFNPLRALNNSFTSASCYNNFSPVFGASIYGSTSGYSEMTPIGSIIVNDITATDGDAPNMSGIIRFSINTSNIGADLFSIDPVTGVVRLAKSLDGDAYTNSEVRVIILAVDQGPHIPSRRTASATLVVMINEVNDNAPQFSQAQYETNVTETDGSGAPVNTSPFIFIRATDSDRGSVNSQITYRIVSNDNNTNLYFEINSNTGGVSLLRHLDKETQSFFNITITATDNGNPPLSNTTYLAVNVIDVNDNRPQFTSSRNIYVFENTTPPANIFTVSAVDPDCGSNAEFTFAIADVFLADDSGTKISPLTQDLVDQGYFSINATSGEFYVHRELDREGNYSFVVTIITKEQDIPEHESGFQRAHVRVCDINDNSPIFSQEHYFMNISINFPVDQSIIQVTATDADRGPFCDAEDAINQQDNVIRYSLLNAENTSFVIDSITGSISLIQSLNFEGINRYTFTVQAIDLGVPQRNATVDVTINLFIPPIFNDSMYFGGIQENASMGTIVFVEPPIVAYDVDSGLDGMFRFSLGGVDHTDFRIDPTNGEITTARSIDRERRAEYNLMVIATNMGNPPQFSTAPLIITLRDISDNCPHFMQARYFIRVSENALVNDAVIQIIAVDPDELDGPVTYRINSTTAIPQFVINTTTGWITVNEQLCLNQDINYTTTVIATDDPSNPDLVPCSNSITVTILVYDDNRFPPDFTEGEYVFTVRNSSSANTVAGTVATIDRDRCSRVHDALFSLDTDQFVINRLTGVVTTTTELVRESGTIYTFNVTATDTNTTNPLSSTTRVSIVVGEYIPVNILPENTFPLEFPKQIDDTTYVQNFNYFYDAIRSSSHIVTTFGDLQRATELVVNDATPIQLDATVLTPYVYPDKPVFVLAVQVVDEDGSDSFPPVDIAVQVCNNMSECFFGLQQTRDNNVAIVEVPIRNQSWFIDDQNVNSTVSIVYGIGINFRNNVTMDNAAVLVTTPSATYFSEGYSSGDDDFVVVRMPLRPLYPTESASFTVQVVEPVSALTMQCIIVGEGLEFTGSTSGDCYWAYSYSVNSSIIQVQTARRVVTRIPHVPDFFFAPSCAGSSSEESVVNINVRVLTNILPSVISVLCTGIQLVSVMDGQKTDRFEPIVVSYVNNSVSINLTQGIVTVAQETVEQMYATTSETVIFNDAVLSGENVISVITVTGIIIAADIRQFNMRTDARFQLNCNTSNTSVLHVSSTCSHLFVDGTELSGSKAVQVHISVSAISNVPLSGQFSRSLTIAVWYPSLPIILSLEDPVLNAIRGWTFLRSGSCSLQAYQTTQVHACTVYSASPSTSTASVLVDHLLNGALRSSSTVAATVNGLTVTGNLLPGSSTISAVRNGRQLGSVTVTVVRDFVNVIYLTVVHSKTLQAFFTNSSFLPLGEQIFTVELDNSLNTTEDRSELVSAAIFSDGQYYTLNNNIGLKYASLDESSLSVTNNSITPVSSGTGKYLQVDWNSLCDNTNIFSQAVAFTITLEQPTSISVNLAYPFIAHDGDITAQMASYPTSSKIRVTGTRSNDVIDITTDAETDFDYDENVIQIVPDGAGGLVVRSVSANTLGETTIDVRYTSSQGTILRASVKITVVRSSRMSVSLVPYPPYPGFEEYNVTTLGQYGNSGIYQKAMVRSLLHVQANGMEVDAFVIPHSALSITISNPIFTLSSNNGVLEPQSDGVSVLNITFSTYSVSITLNISSLKIVQVNSINRLEVTSGDTLVGIQGEVVGYVEADVTFTDNTRYVNFFSNGNVFISDLLTLSGDVDGVFSVSDGGAVTIYGNAPDTVAIIASNMNVTRETAFYCNLLSGVIELNLGRDYEAPIQRVNVNDKFTIPLYINAGSNDFSIIEIGLTYDYELLQIVSVRGTDIWPRVPIITPYPDVVFFESSVGLFDGITLIGGLLTEPRSGWLHLADIEFMAIAERDYAAFINAEIVVLMDGEMPPQPLNFGPSPTANVSVVIGNGTDFPPSTSTVPPFYYEPSPSVTRCTSPLPCTCSESERGDINGDCVSDLLDAYHLLINFINNNAVCPDYNGNGICDTHDVFFLFGHNLYLTYFIDFTSDSINPVARGDCFLRFTATVEGRARSTPPQDRFIFMVGLVHNSSDFDTQLDETIPVNGLGETVPIVNGTFPPNVTGRLYRGVVNGSTTLLVLDSEIIAENVGVLYWAGVYSSSGAIISSSTIPLRGTYTIIPPPTYPEAFTLTFVPPRTKGFLLHFLVGFNPIATFNQNFTSPDCINDAGPQFFPRVRISTVSEGSQPNTTVAYVFANDTDESFNAQVTYSFAGQFLTAEDGTFRIDPATGNIMLLKSIDREVLDVYNITVEARDAGVISRMGVGYITIWVGDINDHPPVFNQSLYTLDDAIPEATPIDTVILRVFVTDEDIDENADITYSITSSEPAEDFYINSTTGEISIMRSLDYETHRNYTLNITAQDGGMPVMSDTTLVQISVSPSNDHAPVCSPNHQFTLLVEDYPVGTTLATLVASDADIGLDHAELTFTIEPNSEGYHQLFDINQANDTHASLITNASGVFNRFVIPVYNISVLVTDVGDLNCTFDVEIRVAEGSRFHFDLDSGPGFQIGAVQKQIMNTTTVYRQSLGFFEAFESNYVNGTLAAYRFSSDPPLVDSVTISRVPTPVTAIDGVLHQTTIYFDRPLVTAVAQLHGSSYSTLVQSGDVSLVITPFNIPGIPVIGERCNINSVSGLCSLTARIPDEWFLEGEVREATVYIDSELNNIPLPNIIIVPRLTQPQSELQGIGVRVPFYPVTAGETFAVRLLEFTPDPITAFHIIINVSNSITITGLVDDDEWSCNENHETTMLNLLCIRNSKYITLQSSRDGSILGVEMMVDESAAPHIATVSGQVIAVTGIKGRLVDHPQPAVHLDRDGVLNATATFEVIANEPLRLFVYTNHSELANIHVFDNTMLSIATETYVVRRAPNPPYSLVPCSEITLNYSGDALDIDSSNCHLTVNSSNTEGANPAVIDVAAFNLTTQLLTRVWYPNQTLEIYVSDPKLNAIENCPGVYQTAWIEVFTSFHSGDLVSHSLRISDLVYNELQSSNTAVAQVNMLDVTGVNTGTATISVHGFTGQATVEVTDDAVSIFSVLPMVSTGIQLTATPETYEDSSSVLYVNAEVSTSFASIGSVGHVTTVVYFSDGARMDLRDNLSVQSIVGNAVREMDGQIISQYPGTSVLTVAWNCPGGVTVTGEVEVYVNICQPVGLILQLMNDRLAHDDTGLIVAGIPDQTVVTVWLNFGDDVIQDVTNTSEFGGPHSSNIWMPFNGITEYNDSATLNVSYNYHGQVITGNISATIVEVKNISLSIRPYGNPNITTDTLRYITNLTEPQYQQASITLSAALTDGSTVNIPTFNVNIMDGDDCNSNDYVFTPCSTYSYTYGTPNKTVNFTTVYISASFASFHDSALIVVGDCIAPVEIIAVNVIIMDTAYPSQKQAIIALSLSDGAIIPNVYEYFDNVTQFLSYSTDPAEETDVFSFDLANGNIIILTDHYKMAEVTISPVPNPNNVSGTGFFVANVEEIGPITVGATTGIPIPPVQVSDRFTVNVNYSINMTVTGFVAKFTFSSTLLRVVNINSSFTGYTLMNLNSPPGQAVVTGVVLGDGMYLNDLMFDVEFEALDEGVSPIEVAIETIHDELDLTSSGYGPSGGFTTTGSSHVMIGSSEYLYSTEIPAIVSVSELFTLGEFIMLTRDLVTDSTVNADHNNDTITSVDDVLFGFKVVTGLAHYLLNVAVYPVQDSPNCTLLVDVYYSNIGDLLPFPDTTFSFVLLTHPDVELLSQSKPRHGGFVSQLDMGVLFEADPIDAYGGYRLELVTPITVVNDIGISVILLTGDYFNSTSYDHLTIFTYSQNDVQSISVNLLSQRSPSIGLEDVTVGTMTTGFMPLNFINNTLRSDYCYFDSDGGYVVRPPENSTVNTIVYNVSAVESGFPTNNEMYFLHVPNPGNGTNTFMLIDSTTGGIRLLQPLDREEISYYTLYYVATYILSNGSTVTIGPALINIRVADINDNTPQILNPNISDDYNEDVVNTSVVTIMATDRDIDENGRITYSIIQGNDLGHFYIDPDTGELIILQLDREVADSYVLKIQASDNGIEPRVNSTFVFITVNDVNDNPPRFNQSEYYAYVNENSPLNTTVPNLELAAFDVDLDSSFHYELVNDSNLPFTLDQLGHFTVTGKLDTEQQDIYAIEVLAIDNDDNRLNSTTLVLINITDLNDNAPQFNQTYEFYFEIDALLGDVVGSVSATDADRTTNGQIKYNIPDSKVFGVHPDTGVITTVQPYDGTASRLHRLTVIATDLGIPQRNDTTYVNIILIESQVVSFFPSNGIFLLGDPRWVDNYVYDQAIGFPFTIGIGKSTSVSAQFGLSPVEDSNTVIPNTGDPAVSIEVLVLQDKIYFDQRMITVVVQASDERGTTIPSPTMITVTVTPSAELAAKQNVTKTARCTTTEQQGFCIVQLVDFPLQWFNKPPEAGDQVIVLADIGYNATTQRTTVEVETHPIYNEEDINSNAAMLLIGPTHLSVTSQNYTMEIYIRVTNNEPAQATVEGNMLLRRVSVAGLTTTTQNDVAEINVGIAGNNWDCCKCYNCIL